MSKPVDRRAPRVAVIASSVAAAAAAIVAAIAMTGAPAAQAALVTPPASTATPAPVARPPTAATITATTAYALRHNAKAVIAFGQHSALIADVYRSPLASNSRLTSYGYGGQTGTLHRISITTLATTTTDAL